MMSKVSRWIVLAFALIVAAWVGSALMPRSRAAASQAAWVYRIDPAPGRRIPQDEDDFNTLNMDAAADQKLINERASEGWELYLVGTSFYYFRRPR